MLISSPREEQTCDIRGRDMEEKGERERDRAPSHHVTQLVGMSVLSAERWASTPANSFLPGATPSWGITG